ncbi:valine--tRNA ligase [Bryobacterales bacterium F-183]|nr:valine--tRNA ligase [Bryobacterales bacterium F-183]
MQLEKVYEPQRFEPHWAQWWIESGIYNATVKPGAKYFSLAVPPPNVTGSLHMGHMLDHTLIDMAVRWHRMLGENTLWVPGTDHAGIATQMVVERELAKDGVSRHDLGREKFLEKVWEWKEIYQKRIDDQMKRLGSSCDWSRERFTLDPGLSRAVRETFVRLYEKDLIYRAEYMVNWCPRCSTALSDLESVHEDTNGSLWHVKYEVKGMPGRYLTVATTRPETMLGDTAVAINAKDERYLDLHGKTVILPLMQREIPIILDDMADPEFGTGCVKVTPAHDPNDFEAGKRHNLPFIKVIGEDAKITAMGCGYAGLDRYEARKRIVADLEAAGLLEKVEPHSLPISKCQRCGTVVEPLVSKQWWVKIQPLADPAIKAVETGAIELVPSMWEATYFQWMRNIRDWCISRQLWWGHRIPAWHCKDCEGITVLREDPTACSKCGSGNIVQDPDVLDTWFSSGLWPFSTLGWPDQTEDLKTFYPTTLMVTGFDILFFWVARMIMFGIEMTGEVPFRQVHLHGLVRDADRQKMSKTKGNVVDPLTVNEKWGTDAMRLSLVLGAAAGNDIAFTDERLDAARAFANKLWNAARFIFLNMERSGVEPQVPAENAAPAIEDKWIQSRLNDAAASMAKHLAAHRYHEAAQTVWHFFWDEFCDWYLEIKKLRFVEGSGLNDDWRSLLTTFETGLRLLHPVMPFITEELSHRLDPSQSISLKAYPQAGPVDAVAEKQMAVLQDVIVAARNIRAERKLDRKLVLKATVTSSTALDKVVIEKLANVEIVDGGVEGVKRSTPDFDLVVEVPKESPEQIEAQRVKLNKEIDKLRQTIAGYDAQLADTEAMSKRPEKVVAMMHEKLAAANVQLEKSQQALQELG